MLLLVIHILLGTDCRVEERDYANVDRFYTAVAKMPGFFTYNGCAGSVAPVAVFATPAGARKIGEIRWRLAGPAYSQSCLPFVYLPRQSCPRGVVPVLEDDYEERVFVVVEHSGRWARIRLDQGTGWVLLSKGDDLIPYDELVMDRMAELTDAWDRRIYAQPGGRSRKLGGLPRPSVTVEDSRRVGGKLWLKVSVHTNPCQAQEPRELARGWVRGYSNTRQPTVRHFSRGC